MPNCSAVNACTMSAFLAGVLISVSWAGQSQKNATGLPTYPHDSGGIMDAVSRSIPNGQHCIHYAGDTTDALAAVEDWYKKALPGARIQDVNIDSMYGSYFKLDGIKLLAGNDIVNVYRTANSKETSIELFKCSDAAPTH